MEPKKPKKPKLDLVPGTVRVVGGVEFEVGSGDVRKDLGLPPTAAPESEPVKVEQVADASTLLYRDRATEPRGQEPSEGAANFAFHTAQARGEPVPDAQRD